MAVALNRKDPGHPLLPAGRVRAGGDLDDRHRRHLHLAAGPDFGLVNALLGRLGLPPADSSGSRPGALRIVAMTVWGWIGFGVIIYLAALQGVPAGLHRGRGDRRRERVRALPHASRCRCSARRRCSCVVWLTINALQLFDEVYVTTRGGPLRATTVIVYYLYDQAFQHFDAGYAAAIAYVLFVVIVVITASSSGSPAGRALPHERDAPTAARPVARAPSGRRAAGCPSARGTWCSCRWRCSC